MELSIRDWMLVIGVLLLLAVALDGYRRASRERRNQVRLSRNAKRAAQARENVEETAFTSELPNGGARVVEVQEAPDIDPLNPPEIESERVDYQRREPVFNEPASVEPEKEMLSEEPEKASDPQGDPELTQQEPVIEETFSSASDTDDDYHVDPLFADPFQVKAEKSSGNTVKEETALVREELQPSLFDVDESEKCADGSPEEILVLNVLAPKGEPFSGEDLLHILLACDCRFGEMNIFHRYESANAKGKIQFSIVNLVEPGVFDLDDIKAFSTPGVSFFIRLPGPESPMDAYNAMVETAQCLARNLNGVVRDENHSTVTEQTLEHGRERIRAYLQRKLIKA